MARWPMARARSRCTGPATASTGRWATGLSVGARFVGTPRVGLTTSRHGRELPGRLYGLGVLDRGDVNFELGIDAQRRESPMQGEASNGVMGRATLGW